MHVPNSKLNNGLRMPQLGLGVWQAEAGDEVENAVKAALACGYRLIDTAAIYGNEEGVGKAIRESGVPREDIFLTTKLWNADHGYENAKQAYEASLQRLGTDYVDLYLIHWPLPAEDKYVETWQALEGLYKDKRVRAIGVSNFLPDYLQNLLDNSEIVPAVNQIELHPYLQQREAAQACENNGIRVESYSPIGRGSVLDDLTIKEIADKYGKTPAQVVLRWQTQHGYIAIPKSVRPERIKENISIFDFEMSEEDLFAIDSLERGERTGADPATANFK